MNEETSQQVVAPVARVARQNSLGIPVAIVLSAAIIAGAIVYTGLGRAPVAGVPVVKNPAEQQTPEVNVAPVTGEDHILGNPNAPIMIVEYSDFDCPFCKNFHETMQKVMEEYGKDGKVAWVYRNFPLEQLHPNAPKIAEASECVASLGGNDAFWKFADLVFGEREINAQTNVTRLPEFAEKAGVSKAKFNECYNAGTFTTAIADDINAAIAAGARGTPYSMLIVGDQQGVINGAQPYANVKQMIDNVLAQTGTSAN
jgi:protein-disulfide isomerase